MGFIFPPIEGVDRNERKARLDSGPISKLNLFNKLMGNQADPVQKLTGHTETFIPRGVKPGTKLKGDRTAQSGQFAKKRK